MLSKWLAANTSIAVITRNSFSEIGIDNEQTSIIHFVLLIASMQLTKNSNLFADEIIILKIHPSPPSKNYHFEVFFSSQRGFHNLLNDLLHPNVKPR